MSLWPSRQHQYRRGRSTDSWAVLTPRCPSCGKWDLIHNSPDVEGSGPCIWWSTVVEYSPNKAESLVTVARINIEESMQNDVKSGAKDMLLVVPGVACVYNWNCQPWGTGNLSRLGPGWKRKGNVLAEADSFDHTWIMDLGPRFQTVIITVSGVCYISK